LPMLADDNIKGEVETLKFCELYLMAQFFEGLVIAMVIFVARRFGRRWHSLMGWDIVPVLHPWLK